jgi:uncharacterized protein with ParB-like and HNH nuclease domain
MVLGIMTPIITPAKGLLIMELQNDPQLYEDYDSDEDTEVIQYDISSTPNDFNVMTLNSFVQSGSVKIPTFQRNYVWDIKRASKWIESLIIGLPVPQLFLYEEKRSSFLVVDGQQRLMSIYYYLMGRFPRNEKRDNLRHIFDENGCIPNEILDDSEYFQDFKLVLPSQSSNQKNYLDGLSYVMLDDIKMDLDLRPIRSIVIKQNKPKNDDSSVFEIFNRLNTGGTNLMPQEIRSCMYNSDFYDVLRDLNMERGWRRFFTRPEPDLHMKDIEIILRGFAMLENGDKYKTTMARFLNDYSGESKENTNEKNRYLKDLFISFSSMCSKLPDGIFLNKSTNKFNIALYEAVFAATCKPCLQANVLVSKLIEEDRIVELENDVIFKQAASARTTNAANVHFRLSRAYEILG